MGFWDWFRSKPSRVTQHDRVWLSTTAKLAGLAAEVSAAGQPVLVLAHFPQTLREVQEALAAVGVPGEPLDGPVTAAGLLPRLHPGSVQALYARAAQCQPADPSEGVDGHPVQVLVAERHFLRDHDDAVVRFIDGLGRPAGVTFMLSLDDPLMKVFAGGWVADLLRRLGVKEGEEIESSMVARRIQDAQKRLAAKARGDEPADSAAAWLETNAG